MAALTGLAPEQEQARLDALARYAILDTPPEEAFDRITALTARLMAAQVAMMSFVDADRVWVKSTHGADLTEITREQSMCSMTITRRDPYLVRDLTVDPKWRDSPLVTSELEVRFYAGAPLTTADGHNVGTLCALDPAPREATADELQTLKDLASIAMNQLELRVSALSDDPQTGGRDDDGAVDGPVAWEDPPERKVKPSEEWAPLLNHVAQRVGHWAKLRHYDGETSAYRAAAQLRRRDDLPPGHWEFLARRDSEGGSNLFARVTGASQTP